MLLVFHCFLLLNERRSNKDEMIGIKDNVEEQVERDTMISLGRTLAELELVNLVNP